MTPDPESKSESPILYDVDKRVLTLAGESAQLLTSGERKYLELLDVSVIEESTSQGIVCVIKLPGKRLFVYASGGEVHAIITELAQGGYRRRIKKISAVDVAHLVDLIA